MTKWYIWEIIWQKGVSVHLTRICFTSSLVSSEILHKFVIKQKSFIQMKKTKIKIFIMSNTVVWKPFELCSYSMLFIYAKTCMFVLDLYCSMGHVWMLQTCGSLHHYMKLLLKANLKFVNSYLRYVVSGILYLSVLRFYIKAVCCHCSLI